MLDFFVSATLTFIGVLGLFVISLMLVSYRSNIFVNSYLVVVFILCSVRNIIIGICETNGIDTLLTSRYLSPLFLMVVPALFLYFKSLVNDYIHFQKNVYVHFIYPFLNLGLNVAQEYMSVLNNPLVENIRYVSLVIFVIVYSILSFRVLYNKLWKHNANKLIEKRHYQLIKNWTLFLFVVSSFLFLRILYAISLEKFSGDLLRAQSHSYLTIIPWLLIYGKILVSPEILYGYPKLEKRIAAIQDKVVVSDHVWVFDAINISNIQDKKLCSAIEKMVLPYIADIESYVHREFPFRNPKLTFSHLAKAINMPASHLNYIFKYHAIVSFVEYKNHCRIKDALEQIGSGCLDTLTLEGLSSRVGFSSYNAFFTAFKKVTNVSPKDYLSHIGRSEIDNLKVAPL